ncbi:MAG: glycosyltransferase [Aphanocapsa sp. GSE-SYN-MK-11-07L]|nr:glycosyltransferase [Aphanocapsa sp. GSE-SYN-MK-11-07L]
MDLCAQMLLQHLQSDHRQTLVASQICPQFVRRCQRIPGFANKHSAFNGDRLLNRFWDYPRYLRSQKQQFDLFHVSDHTYAQLVHVLPPERTGVYCQDIDAFRSLVEPAQEPRPAWYKALANRILTGLQQAAVIFYSTVAIRQQLEHYRLVDPARLIHAPLGIAEEFSVHPQPDLAIAGLPPQPFLLHVGSCIPRKRIDLLLEIFAGLRSRQPRLSLVKVGGDWTAAQQQQISQLGIGTSILHLHDLDRLQLAALYRQASAVLLTSQAEGFGLPIVEALACGALVVASDLPVLREVGGSAIAYCPLGDIPAWVAQLEQFLIEPALAPIAPLRQQQAEKYAWSAHAATIAQTYLNLLSDQ